MNQRPVGHAIDVHARASVDEVDARPASDAPFHILILGDFGGSAVGDSRGPVSQRAPQLVDRDDLDTVIERIAPAVTVRPSGSDRAITLGFRGLGDFHPDRLCEVVPHIRALRDLRRRLADPSTFRQALEEVEASARPPSPSGPETPSPTKGAAPPPLSGADLLNAIVSGSKSVDITPSVGNELGLDAFVREVVRPHLVESDPRQPDVLARMDDAIARALRGILHDPAFQALERIWREAWFLVRRIETSGVLKVFIVDLSREELGAVGDAEHALRRIVVDERAGTPGAIPWSLIVADFAIGTTDDDVALLPRLAALGQQAGAPVVLAADPSLVFDGTWPDVNHPAPWSEERCPAWSAFRQDPHASWLALTFPRFLLRMPYGDDDDPCDMVRFEEASAEGLGHEHHLWGHGGFLLASLLGRQFSSSGRSPRLSGNLEAEGLPLYLRRVDGDSTVQPCAEVLSSERWAATILEHGVIPIMSIKDSDGVRIARVQSAAQPPTGLAGRWS